jgi:hypothetical protein
LIPMTLAFHLPDVNWSSPSLGTFRTLKKLWWKQPFTHFCISYQSRLSICLFLAALDTWVINCYAFMLMDAQLTVRTAQLYQQLSLESHPISIHSNLDHGSQR